MKIKVIALLFLGMMTGFAQTTKKPAAKKTATIVGTKKATPSATIADGIFAEIETSKGKINVRLEYKQTPVTVANFVALAEGTNTFVKDEKLKGKPFYDGLKWHRVIKDFMIQGGDPLGNGSGNPGYSFKDEIVPEFKFDKGGILAMANSGPSTNGSQFFITHKDTPWLTGKHTIFGYVTSGMDIVNAIAQDDIIKKITITKKGAEAKKFDAAKIFSDYYANKDADDKKQAEIQAEAKRKQAEAEVAAKKAYDAQYAPVKANKVKALNAVKATTTKTESGLQMITTQAGNGKKPSEGATIYVYYAGFLEDGTLFDSNYESVSKTYGKFDQTRASQNGYMPFPFQAGKKDGLIPGFLEGLNSMSFGEKKTLFIPAALAYGERGAGAVIPPNSNIIFEVEVLENMPIPNGGPSSEKKQ